MELKGKGKEIAEHTAEELQKLVLSYIPAGSIIDAFVGYYPRLKQKRVTEFSASLKTLLEEHAGRELSAEDFTNEDFVDVMESVMSKVHLTKSDSKLERLRNILFKQIVAPPSDSTLTLKLVELLHDINDIQILILNYLYLVGREPRKINFIEVVARNEYRSGLLNPENFTVEISGYKAKMTVHELDFYITDLYSKGLVSILADEPDYSEMGADKIRMENKHYISKIGILFMDVIKGPEESIM